MSTLTITSTGIEFTNADNEVKSITIDDANNKIDFEQFSIITEEVENREYVPPQQQQGGGGGGGGNN
jgi:hypothetical protein